MNRRSMTRMVFSAIALVAGLGVVVAACDREQYEPDAAQGGGDGGSHHYSLQVEGTEFERGDSREVTVRVAPQGDLWINLDFPWGLEVEEAQGVELAAEQLEGEDMELSKEEAAMPLELTAEQPGEYAVSARGDFSVCNDEICHTLRDQQVEFDLDVQ